MRKKEKRETPQNRRITTTTSREASQMLVSSSSKWGWAGRHCAASLALRIRTEQECLEDNLRGLM